MAVEEERRAKILSHMNKTHSRELTHYIRFYNKASPSAASSPELRDVTLQGMRIRAHGVDYAVPFSPPLASWDESRRRFIEMGDTARQALGISDVYVTEYALPRLQDWPTLGGVLFYFFCAATLPLVVPGSTPWVILTRIFPGGPETFRWIVKAIFFPVIGIHLVESVLFDSKRMHRHGVDRWSALWWKWEISCFAEGVGSWRRIDAVISRKRAEKEASKKKL